MSSALICWSTGWQNSQDRCFQVQSSTWKLPINKKRIVWNTIEDILKYVFFVYTIKVNGVIQVWDNMWVEHIKTIFMFGWTILLNPSHEIGQVSRSNSSDMPQKLNMMFKISQWITSSFKWGTTQSVLGSIQLSRTQMVQYKRYYKVISVHTSAFISLLLHKTTFTKL